MKILVLESSTSSIKSMVYDTDNEQSSVLTQKHDQKNIGQGFHDAGQVYEGLLKIGAKAAKGQSIDAIALSTTWHSLLFGDMSGQAVSPVYLWSNAMAGKMCQRLRQNKDYVNAYRQTSGCIVNASYPYFKLRVIKEDSKYPYLKERAYKIMDQGAYLNLKFTGKYVTSESMVSGSGLYNIHQQDYDESLLATVEISKDQLPKIVKNDVTYPILDSVANRLGVQKNIPVIMTNPDGALNQIGAESLDPSAMTLSVGTSGALRMSVNEPNTLEKGLWNYRSPRTWLIGTATSGACNCVDWFKYDFCENRYSYQELEKKMVVKEDLTDAPFFLPFLFGERCPGWNAMRRGGFMNLSGKHSIGECYYSVLEGVLFNLYQGYEMLIRSVGEPKTIQLSGGILNSPKWMQMCADIFGKDISANKTKDMSMLGAAKWAERCLNSNLEDKVTKVKWENMGLQIIRANPLKHEVYKKRYNNYLDNYLKNS